jgi:hypothetical protein
MCNQIIKSRLLEDLSAIQQQLIAGGQAGNTPFNPLGKQNAKNSQDKVIKYSNNSGVVLY